MDCLRLQVHNVPHDLRNLLGGFLVLVVVLDGCVLSLVLSGFLHSLGLAAPQVDWDVDELGVLLGQLLEGLAPSTACLCCSWKSRSL